ncbi:MAG TPA: TonB family protein [Blastocatellia bacterium]|nr:TonB family protein [Blastocatellia bacterium]
MITTILFIALTVIHPVEAQPANNHFGPVVGAYLTSLTEELRELEFQVSHREISRNDYERTRQRLLLLRSLVERRAASAKEDRVPEFQVLTSDEFGTLGLSARPDAARLRVGTALERQWKLIGIENNRKAERQFFVFEKLSEQQPKTGRPEDDQMITLPVRKISVSPEAVIETIIVPEDEFWLRIRETAGAEERPAQPATKAAPEAQPAASVPPPAATVPGPAAAPPKPAAADTPAATAVSASPVATSVPAPKPAGAPSAPRPEAAAVKTASKAPASAPPATAPVAAPTAEGLTPRVITLYTPAYTIEARGDNIEGEVIVSALFCHDGWIREIEVVKGLGHGLDERAVSAIKRTMFEPAVQNGKPIDARAQVLYRFTLDKVTAELLRSGQSPAKGTQP